MTRKPPPKQPPIPSRRCAPPPEAETEEEAAERQAEFERQRAEYEEERQRREEERKQQFEREQAEIEAEHNRRAEILKGRQATFDRILENAPPCSMQHNLVCCSAPSSTLTPTPSPTIWPRTSQRTTRTNNAAPKRYCFPPSTRPQTMKLTRFALRLALAGHVGIPREGEFDFLTEAETVFVPPQPTKRAAAKKAKQPTPVNSPAKGDPKAKPQRALSNKKIAA